MLNFVIKYWWIVIPWFIGCFAIGNKIGDIIYWIIKLISRQYNKYKSSKQSNQLRHVWITVSQDVQCKGLSIPVPQIPRPPKITKPKRKSNAK